MAGRDWPNDSDDFPGLDELLGSFNAGDTFQNDLGDWLLMANLPYGVRVALGSMQSVQAPADGLKDMSAVADFLAAGIRAEERFTRDGVCVHDLTLSPLTGLIRDRPDAQDIDRTRDLATWAVCLADNKVEWDTTATAQDYTAYWQGTRIAHPDSYATHLVNAALDIDDAIRMNLSGVTDSIASDVRLITCGVHNILNRGVSLRDDDAIIAQLLCLAFKRWLIQSC
jgi:hypothetical protein